MSKFIIDFAIVGHIEIEADNEKEALEKANEDYGEEELLENAQDIQFGKNYVDEI